MLDIFESSSSVQSEFFVETDIFELSLSVAVDVESNNSQFLITLSDIDIEQSLLSL